MTVYFKIIIDFPFFDYLFFTYGLLSRRGKPFSPTRSYARKIPRDTRFYNMRLCASVQLRDKFTKLVFIPVSLFQRPNGFRRSLDLLFVVVSHLFRTCRITVTEARQRIFDFFERRPERRMDFVQRSLGRFVRVVAFCTKQKCAQFDTSRYHNYLLILGDAGLLAMKSLSRNSVNSGLLFDDDDCDVPITMSSHRH